MKKPTNSETVAERAYRIWEEQGKPEGKDLQHWLQAETELSNQSQETPTTPKSASTKK